MYGAGCLAFAVHLKLIQMILNVNCNLKIF